MNAKITKKLNLTYSNPEVEDLIKKEDEKLKNLAKDIGLNNGRIGIDIPIESAIEPIRKPYQSLLSECRNKLQGKVLLENAETEIQRIKDYLLEKDVWLNGFRDEYNRSKAFISVNSPPRVKQFKWYKTLSVIAASFLTFSESAFLGPSIQTFGSGFGLSHIYAFCIILIISIIILFADKFFRKFIMGTRIILYCILGFAIFLLISKFVETRSNFAEELNILIGDKDLLIWIMFLSLVAIHLFVLLTINSHEKIKELKDEMRIYNSHKEKLSRYNEVEIDIKGQNKHKEHIAQHVALIKFYQDSLYPRLNDLFHVSASIYKQNFQNVSGRFPNDFNQKIEDLDNPNDSIEELNNQKNQKKYE